MIIDNSYFLLFGPIVILMPTGRPTSLSCCGFLHFTVQICWKIVGVAWSKQVIKKVLFSLQHVLKLELHQFCFASLCSLFGIPNSISQTIQNWSLTISRVLGSLLCFLYFLFVFVCLFLFVRFCLFVCLFVCLFFYLFFSLVIFPGYLEYLRRLTVLIF